MLLFGLDIMPSSVSITNPARKYIYVRQFKKQYYVHHFEIVILILRFLC